MKITSWKRNAGFYFVRIAVCPPVFTAQIITSESLNVEYKLETKLFSYLRRKKNKYIVKARFRVPALYRRSCGLVLALLTDLRGGVWKISQRQEFFFADDQQLKQIVFSVEEFFWRLPTAGFFFAPIRGGTALPMQNKDSNTPKDSTLSIDFTHKKS